MAREHLGRRARLRLQARPEPPPPLRVRRLLTAPAYIVPIAARRGDCRPGGLQLGGQPRLLCLGCATGHRRRRQHPVGGPLAVHPQAQQGAQNARRSSPVTLH